MDSWKAEGNYARFWGLTLALYIAVTGTLVVTSGFLPYGTDNNETFSSLLHARQMSIYGFSSFHGLTNETASPEPNAQAYLYTHQGNFPRLFAYALYQLGAKTAPSQIVITTYTIGLAGMLLAYNFMATRVSPLFGFLFCALLTTDYLLSLQWLVNTWRVWHLPLFFLPLLFADRMLAGKPVRPAIGLALAFAVLFYFELIFALFVASMFALYAAFMMWRRPGRLLAAWAVATLGAVAAAATLAAQIAAQFGWDIFIKDLTYTFVSRNRAPQEELAFREEVLAFMHQHKIVFWDNFSRVDSHFYRPIYAVAGFLRSSFQTIPQALVAISLVLSSAIFVRLVGSIVGTWGGTPLFSVLYRKISGSDAAAVLLPFFASFAAVTISGGKALGVIAERFSVISSPTIPFVAAAVALAAPAIYAARRPAALIETFAFSSFAGALAVFYFWEHPLRTGFAAGAILIVCVLGLCVLLWHVVAKMQPTIGQTAGAAASLVMACIAVRIPSVVSGPDYTEQLNLELVRNFGGITLWLIAIIATGILAALVSIGRFEEIVGDISLQRLWPYALSGLLAFAIVQQLAGGYVLTAYQVRNAPFAVYLTSLVPATGLYVLIRITLGLHKNCFSVAALAAPIVIAFVAMWLAAQALYIRRIDPGRYTPLFQALQTLNASTVVSTYAIPVSFLTNTWSYYDHTFFQRRAWFDGRVIHPTSRDFRYLWLADGRTNPAYQKPEYFVCWLHLNFHDVPDRKKWQRCGHYPVIADIRNGQQMYLHHEEIARDATNDLWSIVKIDWLKSPIQQE